jgi:hypothetical protein
MLASCDVAATAAAQEGGPPSVIIFNNTYTPAIERPAVNLFGVKRIIETALAAGLLALSTLLFTSDNSGSASQITYLGFDRNDYPGDSGLKLLRSKFSFTGFWLNNPPGASSNSWTGKRRVVQELGFGFLIIFNGRTFAQIRAVADATRLGASNAAMAVSSARSEGFPARTIIFLDQEEGGRLLPEQRAYLHVGQMECNPQALEPACIVLASPLRKARVPQ